ncbi:MAG: glycosyltransferase family 2 protein [Candidatus Omnitrophota bacterium]
MSFKENVRISVVIPAYNCGSVLRKSMLNFKRQTVPRDSFEIILIDDCSDDGTQEILRPFVEEGFIRYIRNKKKTAPAAGRNKGIDAASGEIILFLDGDNVPAVDLLEKHLESHRHYPAGNTAVLGNIAHPVDMKITPLMLLDDLSETFSGLRDGFFYGWEYFATTNISIRKNVLGDIRFNEMLFADCGGFEDTDLAFRLSKRGLRILYNGGAVSWHYHFRTPAQFLEKIYKYGNIFGKWLDTADPSLKTESGFISRYLPYHGGGFTVKRAKYFIQRCIINDRTIPFFLKLARGLEKNNEKMSVFLYRRMFNYFFVKGYRERLNKGGIS